MKKLFSFLSLSFIVVVVYTISVLTGGCAQIMMPTGGPKDTLPPVLLNATPPSGTTHFNTNRVVLTFDEYIQLDNAFQNVLVSPLPKKTPFVDFKLKTVSIRIYDTLQPDKTYSIQFGKSIKDLNEGNLFLNYNYVFSTGSVIDSTGLNGRVIKAETGKIDSTLTVLLQSDLSDSAVFKHKPEYIARLDSAGRFSFKFITPGSYHLFALKDESGQYIYNHPQQLFAFASDTIHLIKGTTTPEVTLYAYVQETAPEKPAPKSKDTTVSMSNNLESGIQDLLKPLTLTFGSPLEKFDSARVTLTDTLFQKIDHVHYLVDSGRKQVAITYNWPPEAEFRLILPKDAVEDSSGHHLAKTDTLKFKTKATKDYGSITLNFTGLGQFKNPVLQLWTDKDEYGSYPLTSEKFHRDLINPGKYFILILEDINGNGRWDPGNYGERKQPEIVHRLPDPITIRGNWENEKDINLATF